jgi:aldehyde:ferredoxin oxidoreductase
MTSFGYTDRILRVNLSDEKITIENPGESFQRRYFGGRGLISYYLLKELPPHCDPLGPKNLLVFACGPITGAPISGGGRNSVGAKSPLTNAYGEAEAGGYWGAELKRAGYDAVIVEGKSDKPVYLSIDNDGAEILSASELWGLGTLKTEEMIRKGSKKSVRVAQIGPGGERLVRYAVVINDMTHVAGRCGMGAVMGSKNLKAISVKGEERVGIADSNRLKSLAEWMKENIAKLMSNLHTYGTGSWMDVYEHTGNLPVNNFRDGLFPNVDSISAKAIKASVSVGMGTCYACVVACKKKVKVNGEWNVNPAYGGPEYETIGAFGPNCGVDNLEAICKANELCQEYAIDTISTGGAISFAMECFENGLISKSDTDGLELKFGNATAMIRVIEMIADRQGIGDILAEGVKIASERIPGGASKYAVHVKGLEVPLHDPRLKRGLGLGYAVSPTGADHQHNIHDDEYALVIPDSFRSLGILEPVPMEDTGPDKVRLYKEAVSWLSLDNCLVFCQFPPWTVSQKVEIVQAVTGWNVTSHELMRVSERAINMCRIFNIREGLKKTDDWLPPRFFQPASRGPLSNTAWTREELSRMIETYYAMMGWNKEGIPSDAKLHELDIGWIVGA